MIPQSPEIQKQILQQELDSVEENLEVLTQQGEDVSNGMLKGVEKRKANLEAKIKALTFDIENRKDDVVDFKLMGIDHLLVDESHYQNFYEFPKFRIKLLILILLHFNIVRIIY